MGVFEIEIERMQFQNLLSAIVRLTTIPEPTLEVLGDDQLITDFQCANVQLTDTPSGLRPPPGIISARADLMIEYTTRAEIEAGAAPRSTKAVGWLHVTVPIVSVPPKITSQGETFFPDKISIAVSVIRIDVPGRPVTERLDRPLSFYDGYPKSIWHGRPLGTVPVPVPEALRDKDAPLAVSAVFQSATTVTIRLGTAGQNVFEALADRRTRADVDQKTWLIRVSPEIFTDKLARALVKSLTPPKDDIEVLVPPSVRWVQTQLMAPGVPPAALPGLVQAPVGGLFAAKDGSWGAEGSYRFKKRHACGDADVTATVFTKLIPVPDVENKRLLIYLEIGANPDSGTTFKCWWEKLGAVTLAGLLAFPFEAVTFGLLTYGLASGMVTDEVHKGVYGQQPPGGFELVGGGNDFVIYKLETKLDLGDLDKLGASIGYGVSRADGVVLAGSLDATAAAVGTVHAPVFEPNDGLLFGTWSSGYRCGTGWHAAFELPKIHIRNKVVQQASGELVIDQPVAVFNTSWTTPSKHWSIERPATKIDQYVTVTGDIDVYTHTDDTPTPSDNRVAVESNPIFLSDGQVFLHTDAGLRNYVIGRIPPPPAPPSPTAFAAMRVECMRLVHQRDDVHWLVAPPAFDYGHAALRHWTIDVANALAGTRIDVTGVQSDLPPQTIASMTVEQTGPVSIEVVTGPQTELRIMHDHAGSLENVHIGQQWLLPTTMTPAAGTPTRLLLDGDQVVATPAQATLSITTGGAGSEDRTPVSLPPSLELPDGRVAVWHEHHLILAYPFGGIATPRRSGGVGHPADDERPDCGQEKEEKMAENGVALLVWSWSGSRQRRLVRGGRE